MAALKLSQRPSLAIAANVCGSICVGFGINAFLNPQSALSMFEFTYPTLPAEKKLIDNLMMVYGARDVFMGFAMYAAAYFGNRKILGSLVLGLGAVAFLDGFICFQGGKGEWNHWGYAPMVTVLGTALMGMFD